MGKARSSAALLLTGAMLLVAPHALAQDAGQAGGHAQIPGQAGGHPQAAPQPGAVPVNMGDTPMPPGAIPGTTAPIMEPPYDPTKHGGLSEGAWLRMTRGVARRSTAMMAIGITFIALGATLMAAGSGVYAADNNCTSAGGFMVPCGSGQVTGTTLLVSGIIALGLGIPLTVHGASDVPRFESESVSLRITLQPFAAKGAGHAGLTLQF
jgi:hypothetical protein